MEHSGYVYLIRHPDGYYKVGRSKNPAERRQHLEAGTPYSLEIDYLINTNDSGRVEQLIHEVLEPYHHKREWFEISSHVLINSVYDEINDRKHFSADVYDNSTHQSLFNPPKPEVIDEGNVIFAHYVGNKGNDLTKMATMEDVNFDISEDFDIDGVEITLSFDNGKDKQLIQNRGENMIVKQASMRGQNARMVSTDVSLTAFYKLDSE